VRELKTRKTTASVQAFLKKAAKGDRYQACQFLLATFENATKDKAAMWGSAIVGVGAETMTYANGDRLDWPIGGFSPRAQNIAIYGMRASPQHAALMKKIGKAKLLGLQAISTSGFADPCSARCDVLCTEVGSWTPVPRTA